MPEGSFEQQARRRAEGFRMEPKPEVWQSVEAAIAPPERKRRVLLWWWLLPLCIGGMIAAVWVANRRLAVAEETAVSAVPINKRIEEKKLPQAHKTDGNEVKKKAIITKKGNEVLLMNKANKSKHDVKATVNNEGMTTNSFQSFVSKKYEPVTTNSPVANEYNRGNIKLDDNKKDTAAGSDILNSGIGVTETFVRLNNENKDTDSSTVNNVVHKEPIAIPAHDSTSDKLTTENTIKIIKKNERKWQIGVMSEIGIASWAKSLLENNNNKSLRATATTGGTWDNPVNNTGDSSSSNSSLFRQTKNGIDAAAGVAVRKAISNRFYFSALLGYRYQQYEVSHFANVLISQPYTSSVQYLVSSDNYHTHFLNANTAIGAMLFTGKRNALSAEAGVDNSFLLVMKQEDKTQASAAFTSRQIVTGDFYRWQPQLTLSMPFGWHSGNSFRFQVAPFARFGLRSFEKGGDDYKNNRLVSAGVQAVYFFK